MNKTNLLAALAMLVMLSACVPAVIAGGGETAQLVAQERTAGASLDDADIYVKIKGLYLQQDYKDLLVNVDIKVMEGRVLLTGNVDNPQSEIDAVRLAWQVVGVKEVINEITMSGDKSGLKNYALDTWITTQAKSKLLVGKYVRSINYTEVTVNQVVYVMGIAQDQAEIDRVTDILSRISQVERVVSYARTKDDPRRNTTPTISQ